MAILLDLILLTIIIYLGSYIMLSFLSMGLAFNLICSALITIVAITLIKKIMLKNSSQNIKYRKFVTYLIWQGEDTAKTLLRDLCGAARFEDRGEYVLIDGKAVFLWTKYGAVSPDTVVRFYRACKKDEVSQAYILSTNCDKKTMAFVKSFGDVSLSFSTFKQVYRSLKKQNKLPSDIKEKVPTAQLLKLIFQSAFNRKNGFRFAGISVLLLAISFFTPFRNYYITLAAINLALSASCLIASFIRR